MWDASDARPMLRYTVCIISIVLVFIRLLRIRRKRCAETQRQITFSLAPHEHVDIDIEALAPAIAACADVKYPRTGDDMPCIVMGDMEASWKVTYEEETGTC